MYTQQINQCRFCDADSISTLLFKYGVRHYTCQPCGFKKWGDEFLDKLPLWQVNRLGVRACEEHGWPIRRLEMYAAKRERDGLHASIRTARK